MYQNVKNRCMEWGSKVGENGCCWTFLIKVHQD